jgi:adenylate cyclase
MMQFRIGVNLGDVIDEDGRIYGDGVNIAARVESLAEAGGICISGRAHDQVENKLGLEYEDLGKHEVKNISRPIQVYRVLSYPGAAAHRVVQAKESLGRRWRNITIFVAVAVVVIGGLAYWQYYMRRPTVEPASVEKMAHPLPDKPSIAVLPFDNMSGDPKQEYFSDGIAEDIITTLSKSDQLFVIARNSTFVYKGKPVEIKQVAEELGVRYVLEGSFRRTENRVRITAQLIDAINGHHLWAERYDRDVKDIFALQDEITMKIVDGLRIKLTYGEQTRMAEKQYKTLKAKLKFIELIAAWNMGTDEGYIRHGQLAREIIDIEPDSPVGYSSLGWNYWNLAMQGKSPSESIGKAFQLAQKAISLDESNAFSYALLSNVYTVMRQYEKAISAGEKGVDLLPNGAFNHAMLAMTLSWAGEPDRALYHIKQGIRLDPYPEYWYYWTLGRIYFLKGQYEEALAALKKADQLNPNTWFNNYTLAITYVRLGRQEEAEAAAKKVLEINPTFSLERLSKTAPLKNQDTMKRSVEAALKAGLPYTPPLPLPDKPSIAVLAFDNLSGDPEQEYFSDGISEEIISALSKTDQLFVIARNSSFTYKGKPVNVKQISRELGVRYVLEGSVRKSENTVRVTAQLIDATMGHHLWSERYDRDLKEIFAIQDEITMKIITALQVELTEGEQMRIWSKRYKRLDVQLKAMELLSLWREGSIESYMRHGQVAQEVIDMAPELAIGYRTLGWHHWILASYGKSPRENLKKAFELAQKAISLDNSDGFSHALLGSVYSMMKQHEKAIVAGQRSIELDPNVADINVIFGQTLNYAGRPYEGMEYIKKAIRLNPYPPYFYFSNLGESYQQMGQPEAALKEYKKAVQLAPRAPHIHGALAVTYILVGRQEEARASAAKCLELAPFVSINFIMKTSRLKNKAHLELIVDAMRKAGFPEGA